MLSPSFLPSPPRLLHPPSLRIPGGPAETRHCPRPPARSNGPEDHSLKMPFGRRPGLGFAGRSCAGGRGGGLCPPAALGCLAETGMYNRPTAKDGFHLEGTATGKRFSVTLLTSLMEGKSFFPLKVPPPPPAVPPPSGTPPVPLPGHRPHLGGPRGSRRVWYEGRPPYAALLLTTAVRIFAALQVTYHIKGWLSGARLTDLSLGQLFSIKGPFSFFFFFRSEASSKHSGSQTNAFEPIFPATVLPRCSEHPTCPASPGREETCSREMF